MSISGDSVSAVSSARGGSPLTFKRSRRILRRHNTLLSWLQLAIDSLISTGLLIALTHARGIEFGFPYRVLAVLTLLLMWIFYNGFSVYRKHTDALGSCVKLIRAWGAVVVALIFIAFATKTSGMYSRHIILNWIVFSFVLQLIAHLRLPGIIARSRLRQSEKHAAIMVGAGKLGRYLTERINSNPWLSTRIVGVVDDDPSVLSKWRSADVPVLGSIDGIGKLVRELGIESVYIALPVSAHDKIRRLHMEFMDMNTDVHWAMDIFGMNPINLNVKEIAGIPLLSLSETPLVGSDNFAKSALDRTVAVAALLVLSPIMIATALAIKLTSPGPVFFRQKRHGWNGKVFEVWKFRSMGVHAEEEGVVTQATQDDPRVTSFGRFIRRTSIDELPQLFNVLDGTMSLVGPRPHPVEKNNLYSGKINAYLARHKIKPGLTGLAQVSGYRGETDTLEKMENRIKHDLEYINNWSIWLDLKILLKTPLVLFSKDVY